MRTGRFRDVTDGPRFTRQLDTVNDRHVAGREHSQTVSLSSTEWASYVAGTLHEDWRNGHEGDIEDCIGCDAIEQAIITALPRLASRITTPNDQLHREDTSPMATPRQHTITLTDRETGSGEQEYTCACGTRGWSYLGYRLHLLDELLHEVGIEHSDDAKWHEDTSIPDEG